jgi:gliding motility-associated-like protein
MNDEMMTRFRYTGLMILLLLLAGRMAAQLPVLDSVCSGAERNYRVFGDPGSTYSWLLTEPGGNTTLLPSDADTVHMTWNFAPGTYALQAIQHALNGCDADAVFGQVIIFESPAVFAGTDGEICEDGFYHLVFATADFTSSFVWTTSGDGTFDYDTLLDATYTPGPNDILAGSVVLTITGYGLGDEGTCDPSVSDMTLTIASEVIPEFIPVPPLCQFSEPPVLPATSVNGISGTWDPPVINTNTTGLSEYLFTPDDDECAVPLQMRIYVGPNPEVYAGADQTIPYGSSTTIPDATATGVEPLGFSWSPDYLLLDPNVLNPTTVDLTATTTFILRVADSIDCISVDSVTIFVEGAPLTVNPAALPDTLCLGETVQLLANAAGGSGTYTYNWTSVPPGFTSILANPTATPSVTTTYFVEVNDGVAVETGEVTVTVNPLPEVYAGADQVIPMGNSTTIGDATASGTEPLTYSWTPANLLLDPTVLHPTTVNMANTTVFTLTVTDGNGCQDSDQVTIFVSGAPLAVDPVAEPDSICPGASSQLTANASGGSGFYTYSWVSIPSGFVSSEPDPLVSPLVTTIYILEVDDGISLITGFVTVTVNPLPVVFAGADQVIPTGSSATIGDATASGAEPLSYSWLPAALFLDPTVLNPTTVSMTATTVFTLTVTDANGCEASDEVTIVVQGGTLAVNPTAEPGFICVGDSATLYANASGGSGIYTYSWTSSPAGFVSVEANPEVGPVVTTTYTVEVSDGTEMVTGSVTVTVNPLPVVFAGNDQTIPPGTATTIGDATASGAEPLIYSWAPAGLLVDPTVLHPVTVSLALNTTFTLTILDANGCENSDEVTIYTGVEPLAVDPYVVPEAICQRESAQLFANASGGSGAYSYTWTSVPPGLFTNEANPVVNPLVTTEFIVEVTDGFDTVTGNVTLVVYPLPVMNCPDEMLICGDSPAMALTQAAPAGGIYVGPGIYQAGDDYYFDPSIGEGDYTINYSYTDTNGCSNNCSFIIQVAPVPVVSATIVTDETDGMQNGSIHLFATGVTEHLYYTITNGAIWQTDNGLFTDLSAGTYYCIVQDQNGCDTAFVVSVENVLVIPLEAITGPDELCLGNIATVPVRVDEFHGVATFQLKLSYNVDKLLCEGITHKHPQLGSMTGSVNVADGVITLEWHSDNPVSFAALETIVDLVFSTKEPGQGELEWYATATESYFLDINGSPIDAQFYAGTVDIYEPPVVYVSNDLLVCEGQEVTITGIAQGLNAPLHYLWTWPTGYQDSVQPHFDSVTMANAGYYTLVVTDSKGCKDQKSVLLTVSENPVAEFHGSDTLTVPPGYVLEAGEGLAAYLWNTGDITENIIITQEGLYRVEMWSFADCYGIDSVYIRMVPPECLYIPNAFTPNGDGLNDTFKAYTICPILYYRLLIYNRWGEKLFESNDINEGWDGTKDGKPCPGDAYVYMISYKVQESLGGEAKYVKYGVLVLLK